MEKHIYQIAYKFLYKGIECEDTHREYCTELEATLKSVAKVHNHSLIGDEFISLTITKID